MSEGEKMPSGPIEAGDAVKHLPSGESWVVRSVSGEHLECMGWPRTRARVSDCVLLEKGVGLDLLKTHHGEAPGGRTHDV